MSTSSRPWSKICDLGYTHGLLGGLTADTAVTPPGAQTNCNTRKLHQNGEADVFITKLPHVVQIVS